MIAIPSSVDHQQNANVAQQTAVSCSNPTMAATQVAGGASTTSANGVLFISVSTNSQSLAPASGLVMVAPSNVNSQQNGSGLASGIVTITTQELAAMNREIANLQQRVIMREHSLIVLTRDLAANEAHNWYLRRVIASLQQGRDGHVDSDDVSTVSESEVE
jgi:hypothetical protein